MSATTYVIPQRVDGPSPAVSGEPDDLDDDLPEPEEDLADRSSAEFAVPFPARMHPDGCQRLDGPTQVG